MVAPDQDNTQRTLPVYLVYQTDEDEQLSLPELSCSLSLKAYLRINGLQYSVKIRHNAEHISPSKSVPFIKSGRVLISEYEPIITYMAGEGFQPSSSLTDLQRAEMKAYMALIDRVLLNAERYLTYYRNGQGEEMRYSPCRHHAWPLSVILPWQKLRCEKKRLCAAGWLDKTVSQVCDEVESCCNALSEKLTGHFFNENATELDALVYGHVRAILHHQSAEVLHDIVKNTKLTQFCQRFEEAYFNNHQQESS